MLQKITPFTLTLAIVSVALALGHYLLIIMTPLEYAVSGLFGAYFFIVVLHWSSYTLSVFVSGKNFDKVGFTFLGLTLVKMGITIAYLWPLIREKTPENYSMILQFFAVYFIFLFIEARAVFSLLNKQDGKPFEK